MNNITMYPYCEVAYKEDASLGWKLAIMNGEIETVKVKCKKYNWFDYIVFNGGSYRYEIKDTLIYCPPPDDVHLLSYWIYWQDINRWFVKEDEIIPYPLKESEETDNIQFSFAFETNDNWNDVTDFDGKEPVYISVEVDFKTKTQTAKAIIEISALYKNFEQFITNLKTKKFGVCHIEEFTEYKFLAWEKNDKVRFLVQDYSGSSDTEYVPIVFDVLVDKKVFHKYFEDFYNSLKAESLELLQEMVEAVCRRLNLYKQVDNDYYWKYLEFKTCNDLWCYIQSIKPLLIGNSIDKILFSPDYFDCKEERPNCILNYDLDENNENVLLDSGKPIIIKISNHTLNLKMYGGSWLQISLDNELTIKNKKEIIYYDVSSLFSKNIIGKQIIDIKIEEISREDAEASVNWYPREVLGNNMFKILQIKLENGYSLLNFISFENNAIMEVKPE